MIIDLVTLVAAIAAAVASGYAIVLIRKHPALHPVTTRPNRPVEGFRATFAPPDDERPTFTELTANAEALATLLDATGEPGAYDVRKRNQRYAITYREDR